MAIDDFNPWTTILLKFEKCLCFCLSANSSTICGPTAANSLFRVSSHGNLENEKYFFQTWKKSWNPGKTEIFLEKSWKLHGIWFRNSAGNSALDLPEMDTLLSVSAGGSQVGHPIGKVLVTKNVGIHPSTHIHYKLKADRPHPRDTQTNSVDW